MKKCLSLLIALTMILSIVVFPVSTQAATPDIPEGATLIFAEDFESFADGEILDAAATSKVINNANDVKIAEFKYKNTATQSASVVDGPEAFNTSKVLKLASSDTSEVLQTYFYLNGGNNISADFDSKQIIVEYDTLIDSTGANLQGNRSFMSFSEYGSPFMKNNWNSKGLIVQTGYYPRDAATYPYDRDWFVRPSVTLTSKKTIKYVIERNITDFDSVRLYQNGNIVKTQFNNQTEWNTTDGVKRTVKDFMNEEAKGGYKIGGYENGAESVVYPKINYLYTQFRAHVGENMGSTATIYLDNIKVYAVEPIEFVGIASKASVNPDAGVQVTFDQPFNATASTFNVTDVEGNAVEGASITAVDMSADKKTAYVKVSGLADSTEYKLWIDDEFTSAAGAIFHKDLDGVAANEEYVLLDSFTTHTAFKAVDAPEAISGLIPNDPRNVEFKTTGAVDSVSATYEGGAVKTSMLGTSAFVSFEDIAEPVDGTLAVTITAADGQTIELSIPVTAVSDEIDYIFNDNLEGLTEGSLVSADTTGTSLTVGNFVFNTKAESLGAAGTATIEQDAIQGNVLKFASNGVNAFSVTYKGDESDLAGKVLVYQTKYYFPKDFKNTTQYGNNGGAAALAESLTYAGNPSTPSFRPRTGPTISYNSGNYSSNRMETNHDVTKDGWTDITVVLDKARAGTLNDPETTRRYYDGEINVVPFKDMKGDKVQYDMYDVPAQGYYGIYDFSAYSTGYTSGGANKFGAKKMYGIYNMLPNTDGTAAYIKLDDFRAFYADKFQVTSVSDNASAFIPTKHTLKVVLNQKIDAAQFANVKVLDDAGVEVTGWSAEVANGGYAMDITLPADKVEIGKTYSVVVTPLFHDITSYQGLATSNVDEEIATVTIAEFTAFTATGYQEGFANFEQGRTTTTDITLSVATKLTNTDIKTAFKVVNDENVEVTDGWTATVSDDQKTITLDFTNLATDNYTVTSTDALVNKDGDKLDGNAVEITITAKAGRITLFSEDFETGYTADNWLTTAPANGKWSVTPSGDTTGDVVEVVDFASTGVTSKAGITGKALHVKNNPSSVTESMYITAISQLGDIDIENDYPGKVIVIEGDVKTVTLRDGTRLFQPEFAKDDGTAGQRQFFMKYNSTGGNLKMEGSSAYFEIGNKRTKASTLHTAADAGKQAAGDSSMRLVIDQRNEIDTAKVMVDDVQITDISNTLLTNHPDYKSTRYEFPMNSTTSNVSAQDVGNFHGVYFQAYTYAGNSTITEFYIDNLNVYLVDAFEIASVEGATQAFNAKNNVVKFNFTNKVLSAEDAQANIVLKDADGNVVENGLTITTAEGGYQVVAQLNEDKIEGSKEYTIEVLPTIKDEYSASLAAKYYFCDYDKENPNGGEGFMYNKVSYPTEAEAIAAGGTADTIIKYSWTIASGKVTAFNPYVPDDAGSNFTADGYIYDQEAMNLFTTLKTTKGTSLYAEATATNVADKNVTTKLTLTNPEDKELDVWYIVAAYGQYNEMLGCQAAATKVAAGDVEYVDIDFDAKATGIESVKVYIWDGYKTMVPYQDAETIFGE